MGWIHLSKLSEFAGPLEPPVVYAFHPSGAPVLGFEVRPDLLTLVLTDLAGTTLLTRQIPLLQNDPADVLGQIAMLAQAHMPQLPFLGRDWLYQARSAWMA